MKDTWTYQGQDQIAEVGPIMALFLSANHQTPFVRGELGAIQLNRLVTGTMHQVPRTYSTMETRLVLD
jgi:hypothetical protein